jgi:negative regulator of flagellin synthesis FlgM
MKITSNSSNGLAPVAVPAPVQETTTAAAAAAPLASSTGTASQSAVLQGAQSALREMPEIDQAKVAALRDALARGEVRFDAGKLAGLISRYHGGRE